MSPITFHKPARTWMQKRRSSVSVRAMLSAVGTFVLVCLLVAGISAAVGRKLLG